jgi:hypothetical protein
MELKQNMTGKIHVYHMVLNLPYKMMSIEESKEFDRQYEKALPKLNYIATSQDGSNTTFAVLERILCKNFGTDIKDKITHQHIPIDSHLIVTKDRVYIKPEIKQYLGVYNGVRLGHTSLCDSQDSLINDELSQTQNPIHYINNGQAQWSSDVLQGNLHATIYIPNRNSHQEDYLRDDSKIEQNLASDSTRPYKQTRQRHHSNCH